MSTEELTDTTFRGFQQRVEGNRDALRKKLWMLKDFGYRIVGVSAPAKGNTLLNYCGIGPDLIECIAEVCESKVNRYTPGQHIPVIHEDDIDWKEIDYALLLAWNWADEIKKALRKKEFSGCFVIPLPEVRIE